MIQLISKYYLRFPPIIRRTVDLSINGFFSYAGVDIPTSAENILFGTDELVRKKLFI